VAGNERILGGLIGKAVGRAKEAVGRLLRRPVDVAVGLIPGRRTGPGAVARLTVDRFDASRIGVAPARVKSERKEL
jgi:hypothetical protein